MTKLNRRTFVSSVLATSAAALLVPRSTRAADSRIEILLNEPIGTVNRDIYSHFVEHLGGVVYDGIWVGKDSRVPNYAGLRKELVDNLKKLKPGVIGKHPSLTDLDSGDLKWAIDFRSVYATVLQNWLDAPSKPVLGNQFATLPILKA